jgi:hypothetical protein
MLGCGVEFFFQGEVHRTGIISTRENKVRTTTFNKM